MIPSNGQTNTNNSKPDHGTQDQRNTLHRSQTGRNADFLLGNGENAYGIGVCCTCSPTRNEHEWVADL